MSLGIVGDAKKVVKKILTFMPEVAIDDKVKERTDYISQTKSKWAQELSSLDHEKDDPGTTWNERARKEIPKNVASNGLESYSICIA